MEYTSSTKDHIYSVDMCGRFEFDDHLKFREIIDKTHDPEISEIQIDLDHIEFVNASGLGMLLVLRDKAISEKKKLILLHPHGQVEKMFSVSRFYDLFKIRYGSRMTYEDRKHLEQLHRQRSVVITSQKERQMQ